MPASPAAALGRNFLGNSPQWYKLSIIAFLVLNPLALWSLGPVVASWMLVGEFIFALAMALKCYPLLPGGLLVVEALLLDLATPQAVYEELQHNFPVILLLMFMVAGIYFMKDLLLLLFSRLLLDVHSKTLLVDEHLVIIGSANFDHRSFRLNFEVSVLFHDTEVASELERLVETDLAHSPRVREDRPRPLWSVRLPEALARLVSPLL